ncbi:glycosyltransferase family 2 protein [Lacinutrix jangbogonensis]|uniref:glycosyltransferase family 2 protein n=1 Tax=Lacinutrix jangbogonensis TaxID=1469557 RepID=UPI00068F1F0E|nr:glycosyltransferase family 2 protein [Lacinutrix jangbogonensis]
MNPKVSIIVPNYNHSKFLSQRLDSVFNQTYQNFEVILLDDASTDNSVELLNHYAKHDKVSHLVVNTENSGSPFKQWEKGIKLAKGDYVWIAESDDYCDLNFLNTIIVNIEVDIGVYYVQTTDVNNESEIRNNRLSYTKNFKSNIWKSSFRIEGKQFISFYLSVKNVIPNASAVVFKKDLISNNTFDDVLVNMNMCGDWLAWIKISEYTNIKFINENLNFFRQHNTSTRNHNSSHKIKNRLIEEKYIRDYLFDKHQINNIELNRSMYQRWFEIHTKWSFLKPNFYFIKLEQHNNFTLILKFLKYKTFKL